jgi:hypothetical protein
MYNSGNSSKNVTGASVVDGTLENADFADNGLSGDKIDGGIVSNFQSTGIDDRQTSGKVLYLDGTNVGISASSPDLSGFGSSSRGLEINNAQPTIRLKDTGGSSDDFYLVQAGADTYFYSKSNGKMRFNINGSERMRILPTGGITFNGDTAAANALDDYEEGYFTPTLTALSGSITLNSALDRMSYTKIGRMVNIIGMITVTSSTASGTYVELNGFPFTALDLAETSGRAAGTALFDSISDSSIGKISEGNTKIRFTIDASTVSGNIYFNINYNAS